MSQISRIVAADGAQATDAKITQRARSGRNIRGLLLGHFKQPARIGE